VYKYCNTQANASWECSTAIDEKEEKGGDMCLPLRQRFHFPCLNWRAKNSQRVRRTTWWHCQNARPEFSLLLPLLISIVVLLLFLLLLEVL